MKKILASLLTILLVTIAFVSCNLDGTSGIFREIALSKTPLSIQYKQLLGISGTDLYFRTAKGVERVTSAKVKTTVVESKYENIIQAAALNGTEVLYITNNDVERADNKFNVVDTTNLSAPISTIAVDHTQTTSITSSLSMKNLYANSMILVTGNNGGPRIFELLKYNSGSTAFTNTAYGEFSSVPTDYDVETVIQQTAKEQDATAQMIVSFINESGDRIHYLVDPSTALAPVSLGTQNVQIANFFYYDATNMFVLTTNGDLYHVDSTVPTWTSIGSSSKDYKPNAFALAINDSTDYYLITKPSSKTSAIHVFTIDIASATANIGAGVDVTSGYAAELSLASIVSSQIKTTTGTSTNLLVATEENGMYDISITHAKADVDDSSNGSTSGAEEYTF